LRQSVTTPQSPRDNEAPRLHTDISQWQNGRRGQDGWGRYTRRRKWYRDAELVEISASTEITPSPTPTHNNSPIATRTPISITPSSEPPPQYEISEKEKENSIKSDNASSQGSSFRQGGARKRRTASRRSSLSYISDDDKPRHNEADWGIGDDARMGLE
jgi:hypothetical protein